MDTDEVLKGMAREAVKQSENLRTAVRELTLGALRGRELTVREIKRVVKAVTEGVNLGAASSKLDADRVLGEAEDRRAAPAHFALRRREQAAEDAQKARLAAAVRAGDAHEIAAGDAERESAEERAAASLAVEPLRLQH